MNITYPVRKKQQLNTLLLITALLSGFIISLYTQSEFLLQVNDIWQILTAYDSSDIKQQVILSLRLPRSLTACLIGFNLGAAGLLMQGLTRNPLASPTLFAVSSGAACVTALNSLTFAMVSGLPSEAAAFIGALTGGLLVFLLGGGLNTQNNSLRLILAGIAVNGLLTSLTRAALIIADDTAYSLLHWLSGSLSDIDWLRWTQLWPLSLAALLLAVSTCRGLNLNALGEQTAFSLGINVTWLRIRVCLAVLLLTSISVTIAGPIVFVGLIAPHLARALCGRSHFILLPVSGLSGAALVCWADLLSRSIVPPAETPVGIITALIGTPFFIYLVVQGKS
ncbi:FecCD family ABC transporter permease [Psychromonas aquimarina]|uniref:FecCD family ABC transporter permease n=1 Tax=Psychromonas aquimarina TaxID=444919 RepID=UPI0003FBD795|nr:iron chelate uptake ABC transporter family permease subunit [Psychromonas aquimarina]